MSTEWVIIEVVKAVIAFTALMSVVPLLVWVERRVCAGIQGRIGPNRVGPFGLLQSLADVIKLITKEDIRPTNADKFLFFIAPIAALIPAILMFAFIPFGNKLFINGYTINLQVCDLNFGIILFLAVASTSVYAIAFGGWASNNKYSLLGGLRASAQLISYELIMTISVICVIMTAESASLSVIAGQQAGSFLSWNIFYQPIAALFFYISSLAENKRLPFDLPEAEAELVVGYHTEYSGMKFGMFFQAEYIAVTAMSALFVTLFLGGWSLPGIIDPTNHSWEVAILSMISFSAKTALIIFITIWIRWTMPRFKYTTLMKLSWKRMLPIALANLLITAYTNL